MEESSKIFYPSTRLLSALRHKAVVARRFSDNYLTELGSESETCWYKSPVDPMKLLCEFKRLSLKPGYTLRAYVYFVGDNGHGIVWGFPENSVFPGPETCINKTDHFPEAPKPPEAVPIEDVLEGNRKPWSYIEASIFLREIREFGARWHGCFWSDVEILCCNPFDKKSNIPTRSSSNKFNPSQWKWRSKKVADWRPKIIIEPERVRVHFYIYNTVGRKTIELKEDLYAKGCFKPDNKTNLIAEGPGGIIY